MIKKKLSLGIAVVLILAGVTGLFTAGTVEAHSPSEVSIDYDMEEDELTVDITHSVEDPQDHYIENVVVEVDEETEIDEDYDEQPDDTSFQYTYDLAAESGSTIEVTAYCNQEGSGSDTYEVGVEDEDEEDEEDDDGIPGFTTILLILATVIAVTIYRKRKK